ncbi:BTAD domain-containing putative transcriptional regulator [Nonomuraea typhae]|uniref:BTAD domain-containing putative transcriptional regulator n=1 Tax=Nonomuraea typhae TaxID=2603600 RepID=A0ABW7YSP1_9ACTN
MHDTLRVALLGPVRAHRGQTELDLGSPKQRLLLAALLLAGGRTLSRDQLIDVLWEDEPPATARNVLRTYASRLRSALGPDTILSAGSGYRLAPVETDIADFTRLHSTGRPAEALALWQGEALTGLPGSYAAAQRAALEEKRLDVLERRLTTDVSAGLEVTAELTALVAAHPLRERLRGLLMRALYGSGRQSDAIEVFTDTRRILDEELGVEPSAELGDLYQQVITGTLPSGTAEPRPAQLPGDIPDFTGRTTTVNRLRALLRKAPRSDGPLIVAVSGLGGVGKTTLAVHVAHLVKEAYQDGQLHVDLRGAGGEPVGPGPVLERFLDALGAGRIPAGLDERAALLRTLTVDRRVLFLLDNAATAAQVRPLLPSGGGCAVLVTSRARLTDVAGAVHVDLDVLPEDEAVRLFTTIARVPGDALVARVVRECGHLPLAVRVAAARLAARPRWSVADLLDRLSDERRRLTELQVGDLGVEASFALSYEQLSAPLARAFRRLAVPDSAELTVELAAAVLGSGREAEPVRAERVCEELVDLSLLETPGPGRYRFHDLLRAFALQRTGEEERRAALGPVQDRWLAGVADAAVRAADDPEARERLLVEASCLAAMDQRYRGAPDPDLTIGSTLVVARALALVGALDPPGSDPFDPAGPHLAYARGLLALGLWEKGAHEIVRGKAALESALAALGQ